MKRTRASPQEAPTFAAEARAELELNVLRKLRIVFNSAKKHFRAVERTAGVSGAQLWALIEVRDRPGLSVSDIARRMSVHASTASNLLDKLESRALIARVRSPADQRVVHLHLTKKGARVLAGAPAPARGVVPDALSRLPAPVLRDLARELETLVSCMTVQDRRGHVTPLSDL